MPERKLDLPETLLSVEPVGGSEGDNVHTGSNDEFKDQATSESSIPLSPQWLYSKPSDTKMDIRAPPAPHLNDPNLKDGWRLEASEEKKDWRMTAAESESSRRWREEERETGLLSARRDRRKTDRRADNVNTREDNRTAPLNDRWNDGSARNTGLEGRRDSKWSSRWGPEEKERESRSEKKMDLEKDREDTHSESQSTVSSNRAAQSERDGDSRDKWRPRHRMEAQSAGFAPRRAAPGFGIERGRAEGSNTGFSFGRGRANAIGRSASASTISAAQPKGESVIGKHSLATDTFRYPRGKLLDIYRRQKFDPSFAAFPVGMDESSPVTQLDSVKPMAFVVPDSVEEASIMDIWRGKITSSGVVYNPRKEKSTDDFAGNIDSESFEGKPGVNPSVVPDKTMKTFEEPVVDYENKMDHSWNNVAERNYFRGEEVEIDGVSVVKPNSGNFDLRDLNKDAYKEEESGTATFNGSQQLVGKWKTGNQEYFNSDEAISNAAAFDVKSKLLDESRSLFVGPSSDQNHDNNMPNGHDNEIKDDEEAGIPTEDSYFYYIDPSGNTQGPFLGADIILWFEEGYFGIDLPVRVADAPEGTPFQSLGNVMLHLRSKGGYPQSELDESGALEGRLEITNLPQQYSKSGSLSAIHSRSSEPEGTPQLLFPEGQNFSDMVAEDEEIIFPGRPGTAEYPSAQPSATARNMSGKSDSFPHVLNKLPEANLHHQTDSQLHPFGLLWSELEGSHSRHTEVSDIPSNLRRAGPFGSSNEATSIPDNWSDHARQGSLSVASSYQDAVAARLLSPVEPPPNRFDLAEQLMSQQFQQQLQQRNVLPVHERFNDSLMEHLTSPNLVHHNNAGPDFEHLLALQLQQQRQLQLQQQQQQQLHRQQQLQQQKLLEERQQAQARQIVLEQLLHAQIPDSVLAQSRVDPIRANNVIDQVLLEQQLLKEMQHRSHHAGRNFVPSVEQFAQAKYGQLPHQEHQRDLFELLSRTRHGYMQSLDQILHQEQLQARQSSMGLRQRANIEEERHINLGWAGNENDQFLRNLPGNLRAHPSGIVQVDSYQRQQRAALEDQLNQFDRNHSFQDRPCQGQFEPSSVPFERSFSSPSGAPGLNMDLVNAMVRNQALDMPDLSMRVQTGAQMGAFSSMHQNPRSLTSNQFHNPHLDPIESRWSEGNGKVTNDWVEAQIQQLHINSDRQKRESESKINAEADTGLWMSDTKNDDKARQLLMDLLNQKSGQPSSSFDMKDALSFDRRGRTGIHSLPGSLEQSFSVYPEREAGLNSTFSVGSYNSSVGEPMSVGSAEEQGINIENKDKLLLGSESATLFGSHSILSGLGGPAQAVTTDSMVADGYTVNQEYIEVETKRPRYRSMGLRKGSFSDVQEASGTASLAPEQGEISVNSLARNSSRGIGGFYDDKIVPHNSLSEDMPRNQVPALPKGPENILLRRPPVSRALSSQEGLSELVSDAAASRAKSSLITSDGAVVQPNQGVNSTASNKKDMRFRRASSCSDADASEPSFIDMLKSNAKKTTATEAQHPLDMGDGTQGGRGGKKKGKKGRQIDPALLGFKVTSNRIMMGEIQRVDD